MSIFQGLGRLAVAVGACVGAVASASAATATINNPPGVTTSWTDTSGNPIANNCGNILQQGGTFYWYGWNPVNSTVNCYTSTTLGSNSWTKVTSGGFPMFGAGFHGRPDVIKHPTNGTYVMIVEFTSGPGRNGIEYLTATSPTGPFTSVLKEDFVMDGSGNLTITMGDKGIYQDEDAAKTAYLLCTTDDGGVSNSTTKIVKLNANYIGQQSVIQSWTYNPKREALAMFKRDGVYYLMASRTLGWTSSESPYKTASAINGTWTQWTAVPTSPSSPDSFDTQHDYLLKIVGTTTTSYIYVGDRWGRQEAVQNGSYNGTQVNNNAWFPLSFDAAGVPTIQGHSSWTINAVTGVINGTPQTITVSPAKDAMVKFAAPNTNFGTQNQLQASGQTNFQKQIFLQFNVTTIPVGATVTGSNLLIAAQTTGSGRPVIAHAVGNPSWTETAITWTTRPGLGASLSTVSSHSANVDSNWNLGTLIAGNGTLTIGLDSTFSGDTNFHSREASSSANRPELVITYQP